jgi:hypothetical protein
MYQVSKSWATGNPTDDSIQANKKVLQDMASIIPLISLVIQQQTFPKSPEKIIGEVVNNIAGLKYGNDVARIINSQNEKVGAKTGIEAFLESAVGVDAMNLLNGGKSADKMYSVTDPETGKTIEIAKPTSLQSKLFSIAPGFDRNINANYLQDGINRATENKLGDLVKINSQLENLDNLTQTEVDSLIDKKQTLVKQMQDNRLTIPDGIDKNIPDKNNMPKGGNSDTSKEDKQNQTKKDIMSKSADKNTDLGSSTTKLTDDGKVEKVATGGSGSGGGSGGSASGRIGRTRKSASKKIGGSSKSSKIGSSSRIGRMKISAGKGLKVKNRIGRSRVKAIRSPKAKRLRVRKIA